MVGEIVDGDEFVPATRGPAYGLTRMVEQSDYLRDLLVALDRQGVEVQQVHPEYAPGQFELSVRAEDPVGAADTQVLVREIGVTLLRFFVIRHGVMQASRGGKVKTMLQAVGIGLLVLPLGGVLHSVALLIMYAAVVVTVVTGVDYVARAVRLRRTSERTVLKRARRAGQP